MGETVFRKIKYKMGLGIFPFTTLSVINLDVLIKSSRILCSFGISSR